MDSQAIPLAPPKELPTVPMDPSTVSGLIGQVLCRVCQNNNNLINKCLSLLNFFFFLQAAEDGTFEQTLPLAP